MTGFLNPSVIIPEAINYQPTSYDIGNAASINSTPGMDIALPDLSGSGGNGFMNFLGSDGFKNGLGAAQTAAGLWNAYNSNKLAKQQFRFTKNFANANLANQTQSYNTALNDRARTRGFMEGQSQSQIDQYIANNRLKDRTV